MVSITPDGGRVPPNYVPLDPDRVYDLYCRFKTDELDTLLARPEVAESVELQGHFRESCKPEAREAFTARLGAMSLLDRWKFESRMVAGYKVSLARDIEIAQRAAEEASLPQADVLGQEPDPTTRAALAAVGSLVPPLPPVRDQE